MSVNGKKRDVVCKLECGLCGYFLGMVTSDGRGPLLDDCQADYPELRRQCQMVEKMTKYQPLSVRRHVRGVAPELPSQGDLS